MGIAYPFIAAALRQRTRGGNFHTLEIGCGPAQYRPDIQGAYVGVDVRDSGGGSGHGPDVVASAIRVPVRSASFDLVFGVATFYMIPEIGLALAEAHRVLRPGGRLLIFDYQERTVSHLRALDSVTPYRPWGYRPLRRHLVAAGFAADSIRDLSRTADEPRPLRRAYRLGRSLLGRHGKWLVVEAGA